MHSLRRLISLLVASSIIVPSFAFAAADPISRRDGFLMIWETIRRPANDTRETPFADVSEGQRGFKEITYAKARGLIEDGDVFQPDVPLTLRDSILWLLRTRSIADARDITPESAPTLIAKFAFADLLLKERGLNETISAEELQSIIRSLDQTLTAEVHEVSFYSEKFQGKGTAFGEKFDMYALTAAHRTFPHNTLVRVTNVANGKSVIVRINDRGPFVKGRDMDLSFASFTTIAKRAEGKLHATFERLGDASMTGPCSKEPRFQQRISRKVHLTEGVPHFLRLGSTVTLTSNTDFYVDTITYPDGNIVDLDHWFGPGESFRIVPSLEGNYFFRLKGKDGKGKQMTMSVGRCSA